MSDSPPASGLFRALAALLALSLLEVGCFLLVSVDAGQLVSWRMLAQRLEAAAKEDDAPLDLDRPDDETERRLQATSVLHPYLGFVRDPASLPQFDSEGMDHGFPQSGGLFFERQPNRVIVAVLGGSVARQLADQGQILEQALAEVGRFSGKEIVVTSFAMGSYKEPQQLIALNYYLALGAEIDLVLNVDGFNEVTLPASWNLPRGVFPFYPQQWDLRTGEMSLETRRRIGELTWERERRRRIAQRALAGPWRWSYASGLAWSLVDRAAARRLVRLEQELLKDGEAAARSLETHGPPYEVEDQEEVVRDLVAVWKRSSLQLARLCEGLGIEYHHFLQPNQYVPDAKPLSEEEMRIAWREHHVWRGPVIRSYPVLSAAGQQLRTEGVSFHDLTLLFEDETQTLYRDTCCHLNVTGNTLLAQAIARVVDDAR